MPDEHIELQRQSIREAASRGRLATFACYARHSGPGWLTSALTLGAGSMGGSLYLGVLAGFSMLWIQPLAMAFGVIMLGAIAYVTLSIDERPFRAINRHVNPLLGWSWLAAALLANIVWAMPQYGLTYAVVEQNLAPAWLGDGGWLGDGAFGKYALSAAIFGLCLPVVWSYGTGSMGVRVFDVVLKLVVAVIVLAFFGVVLRIALTGDGLDWGAVAAGLIPNPRQLFEPAGALAPLVDAIGDARARSFWTALIVDQQREVMLGAGAAAVGVNMTFMLPHLLRTRGWDREFRGLVQFDLSTGMFVPFVLATGCVVMASAHQFHARLPEGVRIENGAAVVPKRFRGELDGMLAKRDAALAEGGSAAAPAASPPEELLAATLVRRDASDLSQSLVQLFGGKENANGLFLANAVFGVGVAGMTVSSIALMMLISGFVVCDALDAPVGGRAFRLGCLFPAVGMLWPAVWQGETKAWITVAASVFCGALLPIAYVAFFVLMNRASVMKDAILTGWRRAVANVLMALAVAAATAAALLAVWQTAQWAGLGVVALFVAALVAASRRERSQRRREARQRGVSPAVPIST